MGLQRVGHDWVSEQIFQLKKKKLSYVKRAKQGDLIESQTFYIYIWRKRHNTFKHLTDFLGHKGNHVCYSGVIINIIPCTLCLDNGLYNHLHNRYLANVNILFSILIWIIIYMHMCMLSHVWLYVTPWTVAHQSPLSMEFSRQEFWSGLPFLSQEDLLTQGSNLDLLHCRHILYRLSHQGTLIMYTVTT